MKHSLIEQPNHDDKALMHQTGTASVSISQPHFPTPGTRLPIEILAIIFWMVVGSYQVHYHRPWDEQRKEATTVLHASQVCRFWRFAALDCKRLWGMLINIDFCGARWVEELLRRSNPAPLFIQSEYAIQSEYDFYDLHHRFTSPKWNAVLKAAHRFKTLHVVFNHFDDISPLLGILSRPAPLLECFRLETIHEDSGNISGEYDLEKPLFAGDAPKLRCLVIDNTLVRPCIDFSSFKLVHLDLCHGALAFRLSISTWLDVLLEQPSLKTVTISDTVLDLSGLHPEVEDRQVPLPLLESLELKCQIANCGYIFGNIVLPASCYVCLDIEQYSENNSVDGVVRGVKRLLQNWEADGNRSGIWEIVIDEDDLFTIQINTGSFETSFSYPRFSLQYQIKQEEGIPAIPSPVPDLLESLQGLPFMQRDTVMSLSIYDIDDRRFANSLLSFLSSFKTVSKVVFDGCFMDESLEDFLERTPIPLREEDHGDAVGHVLFPVLKYVILDGPYDDGNTARPRAFYDYLEWRQDMGKAVPNVTICVASPGEFHSLEPCFSNSLTIGQRIERAEFMPSCSTCLWSAST